MTNTAKLFELGQLAEASYADFDGVTSSSSAGVVIGRLISGKSEFSNTQAEEFSLHWQVVSHQSDTISGFSATLFKRLDDDLVSGYDAGQYVYAVRGTAGNLDLIGADGGDIVLDGLALDQIVDLYNDWQRLNTNAGQTYQAAVLTVNTSLATELQNSAFEWAAYNANPLVVALPSVLTPKQLIASWQSRPDIVIDLPSNTIRTIELKDSSIIFNDARSQGAKPDGFIGTLTEVAGHSLGGHLATAFTRLFPASGAEAVTINGAGFGADGLLGVGTNAKLNIVNLFSMLGGNSNFSYDAIHNVYGDKMYEIITENGPGLFQKGSHDALFIEQSEFWNYVFGHGSSQMTDSLAVANLFIRLDSNLASQSPEQALTQLNTLFEKSTNQAALSLETLVAGLSELILSSSPIIVIDDRDSLYSAINNLNSASAFNDLLGKVTITEPPTTANEARSDFGAFLSLVYLTPFALKTNDTTAALLLETSNPSNTELALQWKQDNTLTPAQLAGGAANFSDMWLDDRAAMPPCANMT